MGTQVFPSHIIAFTLFEKLCTKFKRLDFFTILRLSNEDLYMNLKDFKISYSKTLKNINNLEKNNKIKTSKYLKNDIDSQIENGINHLGMYHAEKLVVIKKMKIYVNNMKTLYYYRNRLKGFGLKTLIK